MSMTAECAAATSRQACSSWRDHLAQLLERAGRGDESAFMQFYDHTSAVAYRALRLRYDDADTAEAATQALYLRAWDQAAEQASSGLSPLAWLLSGLPASLARAS